MVAKYPSVPFGHVCSDSSERHINMLAGDSNSAHFLRERALPVEGDPMVTTVDHPRLTIF